MVADIFWPELVMGGVDWKSFATIIVARCNLNPTNAVETFNAPWGQRRGGVCALCTVCSLSPCSVGGSVRVKRHKRLKSSSVLLDYIEPAWAAKGPRQAQRKKETTQPMLFRYQLGMVCSDQFAHRTWPRLKYLAVANRTGLDRSAA
jgi:hypothetical protein